MERGIVIAAGESEIEKNIAVAQLEKIGIIIGTDQVNGHLSCFIVKSRHGGVIRALMAEIE